MSDTDDSPLQHLSIDPSARPSALMMPSSFNPHATRQWKDAVNSKRVQDLSDADPAQQWDAALREFIARCRAEDTYPFTGADDFLTRSESILRNARARLVSFFNDAGLFDKVALRSISRSVDFNAQGFTITVTATLRPTEDPTLTKWLATKPTPGFDLQREGMYRKSLHAHVDVEYHPDAHSLTYRITCISPARLLDARVMSRERITRLIEEKLWLPLTRELRISAVGTRLF